MPVRVSPETMVLVQHALDGVRLTGGRFDPTVLGAVVCAGYDRTYAEISPDAEPHDRTLSAARTEIDPVVLLVRLPAGVGFDPGRIGRFLGALAVVFTGGARPTRCTLTTG
jgi:thiamine biosynthesis lipoprotein